MKTEDIKKLPKEFDFLSKINSVTAGMLYHARKNGDEYEVTCDLGDYIASYTISKKEFRRSLLNDEFVIVRLLNDKSFIFS